MANNVARSPAAPQKFYAVHSGRVPGVYNDWDSAQRQIADWKRPKHKSFATYAEAEEFVKTGGVTAGAKPSKAPAGSGTTTEVSKVTGTVEGTDKKKQKQIVTPAQLPHMSNGVLKHPAEHFEPGTGPLPPDSEDGFDNRIFLNPVTGKIQYKTNEQMNAVKLQPTTDSHNDMLRIYTDGSSLGNGAQGAVAGVGVFFGPGDSR